MNRMTITHISSFRFRIVWCKLLLFARLHRLVATSGWNCRALEHPIDNIYKLICFTFDQLIDKSECNSWGNRYSIIQLITFTNWFVYIFDQSIDKFTWNSSGNRYMGIRLITLTNWFVYIFDQLIDKSKYNYSGNRYMSILLITYTFVFSDGLQRRHE